jgi:hypothetical protein
MPTLQYHLHLCVAQYAYFAIVSAAPALRRYGRYVTSLQLAQFALCLGTGFVPLYGVLYGSGSLYSWVWIQAVCECQRPGVVPRLLLGLLARVRLYRSVCLGVAPDTSMLLFFLHFDRAKRRATPAAHRADKENGTSHEPGRAPETSRRRPRPAGGARPGLSKEGSVPLSALVR